MPRAKKAVTADSVVFHPAIKGFNSDLQCRGFQFKVGETYTHEGLVKACKSGFHAISADAHPLEVFDYYAPAGSRFCRVEIGGVTDTDDDIKVAAQILKVGKEIGLAELTAEAVAWVTSRATPEGERATGDRGAASATGHRAAASATGHRGAASATGHRGAASATGDRAAASSTGDRGAASATGDRGAASATGDQGAASSTGDRGAASATGDRGAASATGDQGAASATGDRGAASATGHRGAASATGHRGAASATGHRGAASATGHQGAASATGHRGAAMAPGKGGCVMGASGAVLFAVERGEWDGKGYPALSTASGIVGQDGLESETWYACQRGKFVEVSQ